MSGKPTDSRPLRPHIKRLLAFDAAALVDHALDRDARGQLFIPEPNPRCSDDAPEMVPEHLSVNPRPAMFASSNADVVLPASSIPSRKKAVIIGIDEVGRGCLAGPVVAAAVLLPPIDLKSKHGRSLICLDDSKLLTKEQREELYEAITKIAVYAVGEASVQEIDALNILNASLLAMKRARQALSHIEGALLLIDGNKRIPELPDCQRTVVGGDSLSASIAAASVIAKVHRDRFMRQIAEQFPEYRWHSNKGYPTADHKAAIARHGLTIWHRRSFAPCRVPCAQQLPPARP